MKESYSLTQQGEISSFRKMTVLSAIVIDLDKFGPDYRSKAIKEKLTTETPVQNRVFILHTDSKDAKYILDEAAKLRLTGKKYIWVLSSFSVGITFNSMYNEMEGKEDDYKTKLITSTVQTSINLWIQAMENLGKKWDVNLGPDYSCTDRLDLHQWNGGNKIYRTMKNITEVEDFGSSVKTPILFSKKGINQLINLRIINLQERISNYRVNKVWREVGAWTAKQNGTTAKMRIEMKGITWPGNSPIPPTGKPDKRFFRIVTYKEDPYIMYRERDKDTGRCAYPSVECKLVYDPREHNGSEVLNNTVSRCCAGLCVDLLKIMSEEMRFDYELYEVPDKTWGLKDQRTGQWNGLIREIVERKADMVLTSLKITPKRSEAIDFSLPFLETGITILVSIRKGNISPTAFLEPYDYPSWCVILVFSVHATGASIFIYEWLSPQGLDKGRTSMREHKFSLFRSLWMIWAMLFGAAVSVDNPRGVSSKFLANVWALFALVFLASYTANLAAFMITKDEYYNLTGITDWRLRNPYSMKPPFRFATVPNGSTEENLRQNHEFMYRYMRKYNQSSVPDGLEALKKGKIHAFIYDATPLEYHAGNDKDCNLKTVGEKYAMTGYGVGVPKGSKYLTEINEVILGLQYDGELERLRTFWLAGACHRKKKVGVSRNNIGILNFTSAFILLAGGMLLGGILLLLEHFYFKFGRQCLRKYDRTGCCALVSLSMGKSLTFEESVMEAIDLHKRHKCNDPLCETQLWKVRHELDLSLIRIDKLKNQLESFGIKPSEGAVWKAPKPQQNNRKLNGYPGYTVRVSPKLNRTDTNESYDQNDAQEIIEPVPKWNRRSLKRSPSYTNAVSIETDSPSNTYQRTSSKVRFNDGKLYVGVDNDSCDIEKDLT
ncbi:hypothetical protein FSP39_012761 [Pinctada imbricata]|uniref:Uncharacterized protein n=1 Tax=Pinctada imbricata TaxID=66713 RepID=A0AA88XY92_PINIB|nr:hypothetical protein FSP39_012761 [Pinctada imbricata]